MRLIKKKNNFDDEERNKITAQLVQRETRRGARLGVGRIQALVLVSCFRYQKNTTACPRPFPCRKEKTRKSTNCSLLGSFMAELIGLAAGQELNNATQAVSP